ncbi:hypothetical protein LTR37_011324 [Vermiconidia calcicola]|uniref:Uncharacterized protein n=1 Tax=Vermiconidia calcicola TaxID=1690605 RepID=A0ACC3N478_9PEZI|nr:hypothetical protein LTR37_011324 [Vermiconidia calcicola]
MAFNFNFGAANSPSTPNRKGKASFFSQAPSTTPAGPPPSHLTNFSTTPAGPPPASSRLFGSSYNAAANTFGHRATPGRKAKGKPAFAVPESSPPQYEDEDAEGSMMSPDQSGFLQSMLEPSPRGLKRDRNGQVREQVDSGMADIARAFARDAGAAQRIAEADEVVVKTEDTLAGLDGAMRGQRNGTPDDTISNAAADLTRLWSQHSENKTFSGGVGPESEDAVTKATYLSTLLLQLHHPHTTRPVTTRPNQRMALTRSSLPQQPPSSISLPRALLDWLNTYHNPIPDDFNEIHSHRPSPSAHSGFWDLVGADLLRGRFTRVIRLLKDAGWQHAATARMDIHDNAKGYEGRQLDNTEEVITRCIRVLETCPALADDWNVAGSSWSLFRQRVRHAIRDLQDYATSGNEVPAQSQSTNMFSASTTTSMAASTARAENRVPQSIYEQLRMMYGLLLGDLLDFAQDWVEASILLTVWWDGEESTTTLGVSIADLAASKSAAFRKSGREKPREVDVAPLAAYRRRLDELWRMVSTSVDDPNFKLDTLDAVQVGLACVFEGEMEAVVGILRSWNQTISTAVVEVAALGGWLPLVEGRPSSRGLLGRGFSSEDLMVLSHGPGANQQSRTAVTNGIDRDEQLTSYSDLLAERDRFTDEKEGWELAISVLGRLDDSDAAQERIRAVLEAIDVHQGEERVEKVLNVCTAQGLEGLGRGIAERYADSLAASAQEGPPAYGVALIYYARAHATAKLKDTLSLLISLSLLHSAAMPPRQSLDAQLAPLLSNDRAALITLSRVDIEAAELLGKGLSGYAMLRRFYDARDQDGKLGPLMRKREAAKALTAVIQSAADCIRGGLYDPEIESAVPVEGLLVLLGECLPLLGDRTKRVLEMKHVLALMGVCEDFEQVSGRIKDSAEGLLRASMSAYRGAGDRSGSLKKSKSSLSSASGSEEGSWEHLAESSWSMLQSAESAGSGKRGKQIEVQRGWDWRKGLDALAAEIGSGEVLMLLRTALAREVARSWGGGS